MSKNLFITGTGTDVGKTYVSALLVKLLKEKGYKSLYYKAAVSGNERINGQLISGDSKFVCDTAKISDNPNDFVSYIFEEPISPHLAARRERTEINIEKSLLSIYNNQDFKEIEIILINDLSTDAIREKINSLLSKYPSISLYKTEKEKGGILNSKIIGILKSKGKYILFLNQNDFFTKSNAFNILYPAVISATLFVSEYAQ